LIYIHIILFVIGYGLWVESMLYTGVGTFSLGTNGISS